MADKGFNGDDFHGGRRTDLEPLINPLRVDQGHGMVQTVVTVRIDLNPRQHELDLENQSLETKLRIMTSTLNTLHADGRIVFSFPEEALPLSEQVSFVAFVKAEWVARQSRFTQQDADRLADEVDASWWSNNKQRILSQIAAA